MLADRHQDGPVTMRWLDGLAGTPVAANWFAPRTGDWTEIGRFPHASLGCGLIT
jgi:hypothetical protein